MAWGTELRQPCTIPGALQKWIPSWSYAPASPNVPFAGIQQNPRGLNPSKGNLSLSSCWAPPSIRLSPELLHPCQAHLEVLNSWWGRSPLGAGRKIEVLNFPGSWSKTFLITAWNLNCHPFHIQCYKWWSRPQVSVAKTSIKCLLVKCRILGLIRIYWFRMVVGHENKNRRKQQSNIIFLLTCLLSARHNLGILDSTMKNLTSSLR